MGSLRDKLMGRPRSRWAVIVLLLAGAALLPAPAVAQDPPGDPALAYWTTTNAVVADADGVEIRTYRDFDNMSLNGGVLVGELPGPGAHDARLIAFDAATGERLYRIRNARLPVVVAGGRKVAFSPSYSRDDTSLSVWMRGATGRERKIARFGTPGFPGIRTGMRAGAFPLDMAFDRRGRMMALVGGLETVRSFDVWLVDTRTKEATRMTRGENSHSPSLTPDGTKLAVRVESPEPCPDPLYGEILIGKIKMISTETGERGDLTEFDCDLFYDTPRWIDNDTLVATRVIKDATEAFGYDLDLVTFDAATGEETELITEGNPCCTTASPSLGKIAYLFSDRDGFTMFDLGSETLVDFPGETFVPHVSGDSRF